MTDRIMNHPLTDRVLDIFERIFCRTLSRDNGRWHLVTLLDLHRDTDARPYFPTR